MTHKAFRVNKHLKLCFLFIFIKIELNDHEGNSVKSFNGANTMKLKSKNMNN